MIIDSILTYMHDGGIGTVGTDIFIGELPDDKSDIVSLVTSPSPEPNKSIPYYTQTVDIWGRFKSYDDGMSKLQEIFGMFHRIENYEVFNYHVYLSYALGMIDDLGRDNERRHLFKLTLSFVYRNANPFS